MFMVKNPTVFVGLYRDYLDSFSCFSNRNKPSKKQAIHTAKPRAAFIITISISLITSNDTTFYPLIFLSPITQSVMTRVTVSISSEQFLSSHSITIANTPVR